MADEAPPLSEKDQLAIERGPWEEVAIAALHLSRLEEALQNEQIDVDLQLKMIELHTIIAGLKLQFVWPSQKEKE